MSRRIAVLDYGIGNLGSVANALVAIGADAELVTEAINPKDYFGVVLPGVGAFGACARELRRFGFDEVVLSAIDAGVPTLGVCVGLQLLYEGSEESPEAKGLGVFSGTVTKFDCDLPIPQMQWNQLAFGSQGASSPIYRGIEDGAWMYFVHSYAAPVGPETSATANYCADYTASAERGSLFGTQFHPEKSSLVGLKLLGNFVDFTRAKG